MFRDDLFYLRSDLVQRLLERDRLEAAVRATPQRLSHSVGMVVRLGELSALEAGVAAADRIRDIAADVDDPVVLHADVDGAVGVTQTAVGLLRLASHGPLSG